MLRRIRQVLWTLFLMAMAPEAIKLAWLLIQSREARIGAFVLACAFGGVIVTTFFGRPTRTILREPSRPDW
jgi:hypothetical protein